MKVRENPQWQSSDSLDDLIRFALREEVSTAKSLPCVWRQIKKQVWRLKRERQVGWARQGVYCAESTLPLSVRADVFYFLLANSDLRMIR